MKFSVFGASGFIGGHLVRALQGLGHQVHVVPRDHVPTRDEMFGHAIYAIGLTADFRQRPFDTIEAHVSKVNEFLRAGRFESFTYLSSTRIYGNGTDTREDAMLSVQPSNYSDLYNISKLAGEAICLGSGLDGVKVARLSNVIGPNEAGSDTFVGALCMEASRGAIRLQTALSSSKDYIWIDDAVSLLIAIASRGTHRVYNVASGAQISNDQWARAIQSRTDCSVSVLENAPDISFPPIVVDRIRAEFAYSPSGVLAHIDDIIPSPSPASADER